MPRRSVRFVINSAIRTMVPWLAQDSTETNLLRLTYDSALLPSPQDERREVTLASVSADTVTVEFSDELQYADGTRVSCDAYILPLVSQLELLVEDYILARSGNVARISTSDPSAVLDILRSYACVPFRPEAPPASVLGSHMFSSGRCYVATVKSNWLELVMNKYHSEMIHEIDSIEIHTIPNISDRLSAFARDEVDVIPIASADVERIRNGELKNDGHILHGLTNSISTLSFRASGPLIDPALRHRLCATFPFEEFDARYRFGGTVFGFSDPFRCLDQREKHARLAGFARSSAIRMLVPKSEYHLERGEWMASAWSKSSGIQINVEGLQMTEYQSAISDPSAADIVWMGVGADHDSPRHWVRYGLLNGRIPVPPNLGRAHRLARFSTEEDILEAERILLSEGWYVPLYRHQQYYFVRNGLQGLQLEMSDWPLPGVHHPDKLTWASRSTGSDSLEGCKN